jgi:hypothetical protein
MIVSEDRLAKALSYLATTDEPLADLLFDMRQAEDRAKAIKDTIFLHEEGSVADRSAKAGTSETYQAAQTEFRKAEMAYNRTFNKRKTEATVVEAWRSLNASRRQGNV